jgi:hypothetical protein
MGDSRGPRHRLGGEYYQIYHWSEASEMTEFFIKRMVTNEKRSVRKLSGAVHLGNDGGKLASVSGSEESCFMICEEPR